MKCPECGSVRTTVVISHEAQNKRDVRIRRRACRACEHRWYTLQPPEQVISSKEITWTKYTARPTLLREL